MQDYIEDMLQKDVYIKNIYKSMEEFYKNITCIKNISFIQVENIFKKNNDIYDGYNNIFGLDYPSSMYFKADYNKSKITDSLKKCLENMVNCNSEGRIENLVVTGFNDDEVEEIFKIDKYTNNVKINVSTDDNGLYDKEEVLFEIKKQLKG